MAVVLRNIDHGLQHENRERYAWDPGYEADDIKDGEYEENDSSAVVTSSEVDDGSSNSENNLKDAGDPDYSVPLVSMGRIMSKRIDRLLCESADNPEVGKG